MTTDTGIHRPRPARAMPHPDRDARRHHRPARQRIRRRHPVAESGQGRSGSLNAQISGSSASIAPLQSQVNAAEAEAEQVLVDELPTKTCSARRTSRHPRPPTSSGTSARNCSPRPPLRQCSKESRCRPLAEPSHSYGSMFSCSVITRTGAPPGIPTRTGAFEGCLTGNTLRAWIR